MSPEHSLDLSRSPDPRGDGSALNAEQRTLALTELTSGEPLDLLVAGGGVTGADIALDAASRGLRTGIVEMGDWASGTSSWSSKLVHGGLRYLYQLGFPLVQEALTERGRLRTTTAPHLVKPQPFLWPLKHHYERVYSAVGVGLYDALARGRCPRAVHGSAPEAPGTQGDAGAGTGDLLVTLEVQMPSSVNDQAKQAIRDFARAMGATNPRASILGRE